MDKLPHEYLQSQYRDDIEILFTVENHRIVVSLMYRYNHRFIRCSEKVFCREMLGDCIRSAEQKVINEIQDL